MIRAQMAAFLVKGMGWDPSSAPAVPIFDDVPASDPLFAYVQLAAQRGLMEGCTSSSFCPDDAITRAQTADAVAAVLLQAGPP